MKKLRVFTVVVLLAALMLTACIKEPAPTTNVATTAAPTDPTVEDGQIIRVSADGDDSADGVSTPVRTISKALELAAEKIAAGDVRIDIADGTYSIAEPLQITNAHTSREAGHVLTLVGHDNTVISGAAAVTGWEKQEGNIWKATFTGAEHVNGLYVDGEPMSLAGMEVQGSFVDENGSGGIVLNTRHAYTDFSTYNTAAQIVKCAFTLQNTALNSEELGKDLKNIRMYFDQTFSRTCLEFSELLAGENGITLLSSALTLQTLNSAKMADYDLSANRYYLVNSYLFLDEEGEYFFDAQTDTLYYCSASSPVGKDCIVPISNGLLHIQGTNTKLASNIRLENLTFAYGTTSVLAENPYKQIITDHYVTGLEEGFDRYLLPAQITVDHASNLTIQNCRFEKFDTSGIALREHVYHAAITDCHIRNVSGSGIVVGAINMKNGYGIIDRNPQPEDLLQVYSVKKNSVVPAKITISNNLVENCGITSIGSCGVLVYYGYQLEIRGNTVQRTGGSGIAVGWGFANQTVKKETPASSGSILIEGNRVVSACMRVPNSGGICTLGAFLNDGLTISRNFVDMKGAISEQTPAIYLDDGSEYVSVTGNLAVGTNRWLCARAMPVAEQDGACVIGEPSSTTLMNCTVSGNYSDRENHQKEFSPGILWPYATEVEGANVVIENHTVAEDWENHAAILEIYSGSGVQ